MSSNILKLKQALSKDLIQLYGLTDEEIEIVERG